MSKTMRTLCLGIGWITLLTGLFQCTLPSPILQLLGAEVSLTTAHFFAIVGMFMALFGGMLVHALHSEESTALVVLWSSLQKFGAVTAVSLGVVRGVFSPLALLVVAFDLTSALVLLLAFRRSANASSFTWMRSQHG